MTWAQGREQPLAVFGPEGTAKVVKGFSQLDSLYRTAHHGEKYLDPTVGRMVAKEVFLDGDSAVVLDDQSLKITMFSVDHSPIHPAVGYRFDYKGRSVVVSGDTIKNDTTIKFSQGADLLFHEALSRELVQKMESEAKKTESSQLEKIMFDIQDYHTSLPKRRS